VAGGNDGAIDGNIPTASDQISITAKMSPTLIAVASVRMAPA
jgi:hypothetical protein